MNRGIIRQIVKSVKMKQGSSSFAKASEDRKGKDEPEKGRRGETMTLLRSLSYGGQADDGRLMTEDGYYKDERRTSNTCPP